MEFVYHIVPHQQASAAIEPGRDGFVHASTRNQLANTAARFFAGQDIVAIAIAPAGLDVRHEPTPDGVFPHIYQAVPPAAQRKVIALVERADGRFLPLWDQAVVVPPARASLAPADFMQRAIEFGGITKQVFVAGAGPAVVIMHEMPGLHPGVFDFARRVVAAGMSVYLPSLFGEPGKPTTAGYSVSQLSRGCVSRDFAAWASEQDSPVVDWLRKLAALAHRERGGPGVGAIGMCFTGGFALGMLVEPAVIAPALSQPSLPLGVTAAHRRSLGLSKQTTAAVVDRIERENLCVYGMRFTHDALSPGARFAHLRELLGHRFISVEIDSSRGNPADNPRIAHSVLTHHFVDRPGHPTKQALDDLLGFFASRLILPST